MSEEDGNPMDGFGDQYGKFELIEEKFSKNRDVHGIILLNSLDPDNTHPMLAAAEHDYMWFGADPTTVFANATPDQLRDLARCCIQYDESYDSFGTFV